MNRPLKWAVLRERVSKAEPRAWKSLTVDGGIQRARAVIPRVLEKDFGRLLEHLEEASA